MTQGTLTFDLLRRIADASNLAVIVHRLDDIADDRTFRVLYANKGTQAQLAIAPGDLIGRLCEEVFPGLREQGYIARLMRVVRSGQAEDYEDYYHVDERIAAVFAGHIERVDEGTTATWFENVTRRKEVEREAARVQEVELAARSREQALVELEAAHRKAEDALAEIARQQSLIEVLSTPVLDLWEDVIALPIVGTLDGRRAELTMQVLLQTIRERRVRFALLDLTGVDTIDTDTADHVMRLAHVVRLLGAQAIVTGIRPAVAQTIVELGLDLSAIETRRNLREALRDCLARVSRGRSEPTH